MKTIPLTRGKVALVDDEDYESLSKHKWHFHHTGYAVRALPRQAGRQRMISMHRIICQTPKGFHTDHIDSNGLNNQRYNLRQCTCSENQHNQKCHQTQKSSNYKGVCWHIRHNKWGAQISVNQKIIHLGYFVSEIDAAHAYDQAAIKYFREFARPNFPIEQPAKRQLLRCSKQKRLAREMIESRQGVLV